MAKFVLFEVTKRRQNLVSSIETLQKCYTLVLWVIQACKKFFVHVDFAARSLSVFFLNKFLQPSEEAFGGLQ